MYLLKTSIALGVGLFALAFFSGCAKSSEQKLAEAKTDVTEAKQDARDANTQTAVQNDWQAFKTAAESKIAVNEKIIVEYKTRMTTSDGKLRAKYDKKIDALETKNAALKTKLENYKDDDKTSWDKFKTEFNHDMDELGTALKGFSVNDKK